MVNLEEIMEKKPYQVPAMQIKYLSWEDIVTSSQFENKNADTPLDQYSGDDGGTGGSGGTPANPWG